MKMLQFANGDRMPMLGLGTWKAAPGEVYTAVKEALKIGYKHIDCAPIYGNEIEVGKAISESISEGVVTRDQLWITSKLWNDSHALEDVQSALRKTLTDLQTDYLDLFLIHWPVAHKKGIVFPKTGSEFLSLKELPIAETWKGMEDAREKGLCKHIGVSNFSIAKLQNLLSTAAIKPEMNQVEMHPYLQQPELLQFCKELVIHVTAYSPLGSSDRPPHMKAADEPVLLNDEMISAIAKNVSASPAQVLISWALHRDTVVIPKSSNADRLLQNLQALEVSLSKENMDKILGLDRKRRYVNGAFWQMEGGPYNVKNLWDE